MSLWTVDTCRHVEWDSELSGSYALPQNLEIVTVERQRTTDQHVEDNAKTLIGEKKQKQKRISDEKEPQSKKQEIWIVSLWKLVKCQECLSFYKQR